MLLQLFYFYLNFCLIYLFIFINQLYKLQQYACEQLAVILGIIYNLPMETALTSARQLIHQQLRKQQLNSRLQLKRITLENITPKDAIQIMPQCLMQLRQFMINPPPSSVLADCLAKLHNIAQKYMVVNYFITQVRFDFTMSRVMDGSIPVDCTWIDLLLIIMQQQWNLDVYEQCSFILKKCVNQMHANLLQQQCQLKKQQQQQLSRMKDSIPLNFLRGDSYVVIANVMDIVSQLLIISANADTLAYFLHLYCPNLIQMLDIIYMNKPMLAIRTTWHSFIELCLATIYAVDKFGMQEQAGVKLELLTLGLKNQCIANIMSCSEQSLQYYEYLNILTKCNVRLNEVQFRQIQSLLPNQLFQHCYKYLQMMNILQTVNRYPLKPQNIRYIFMYLFNITPNIGEFELKQKSMLILLVKKHLDSLNNELEPQNLAAFCQMWQNQGKHNKLTALIDLMYNHNQTSFQILMQLVYYLLKEDLSSVPDMASNELSSLWKYSQFEYMLIELGMPINRE